jgi:hypothetical protein
VILNYLLDYFRVCKVKKIKQKLATIVIYSSLGSFFLILAFISSLRNHKLFSIEFFFLLLLKILLLATGDIDEMLRNYLIW